MIFFMEGVTDCLFEISNRIPYRPILDYNFKPGIMSFSLSKRSDFQFSRLKIPQRRYLKKGL